MDHELYTETISTYYGPNLVYGYCGPCHNPDGYGVGRCDTTGGTQADVEVWFAEHAS